MARYTKTYRHVHYILYVCRPRSYVYGRYSNYPEVVSGHRSIIIQRHWHLVNAQGQGM